MADEDTAVSEPVAAAEQAPAATDSVVEDDQDEVEDLEFLIDDIEDQIAPLAL